MCQEKSELLNQEEITIPVLINYIQISVQILMGMKEQDEELK